jgi:hypothetical protein
MHQLTGRRRLCRSVTVLADKVAATSALQDRRLRSELQTTYSRLVESVATIASRRHEPAVISGDPLLAGSAAVGVKVSLSQPTYPNVRLREDPALDAAADNIFSSHQMAVFFTESVVPNLRRFLVDTDRVLAACSIVNTQMVVPALRSKARCVWWTTCDGYGDAVTDAFLRWPRQPRLQRPASAQAPSADHGRSRDDQGLAAAGRRALCRRPLLRACALPGSRLGVARARACRRREGPAGGAYLSVPPRLLFKRSR